MTKKNLWNFVPFAVFVVLGLWHCHDVRTKMNVPRAHISEGQIRVSSTNDGPFVITHLICRPGTENEKRTAALDSPVAIIDSAGAEINPEKLKWLDFENRLTVPPPIESIEVLYYQPMVASQTRAK